MTTHFVLLPVVVIFPIVFAGFVFFHRRRIYAKWAKLTSLIACVAGFASGGLDWIWLHWRSFHLKSDAYYSLVGLSGLLGGLCAGFLLSIVIARPYQKRNLAESETEDKA